MPRSREVIDDRFMIEQLAGFGGMGQIYRARDLRTHSLVALKIMHDAERIELERFAREAQVLATLSHPGIVRYIDNGITSEGDPYLVMEWLSGETLSTRLQRTQLTVAEALALGRRAASALGAIHRGGVVHRDIKPTNLFLRDAMIDKVVLIDFGMARRPLADTKLTVTGTMLGTPGYIAPEQVNGVNLDGRADIFSLGCVLYRCIAGQAPFRGPDALRMLVNGLPEQLPRLREFRPSIPEALDDLVARMLARSPEDRPPSGDVVAAELLAIEESEPSPLTSGSGSHRLVSYIMAAERRLMCLVLARMPSRTGGPPILERERALQETVERHRGRLEILASGVALAILSNADAATDLAARATRCAEAVRPVLGGGPVVVVTGREILGPGLPSTELFQRALEILEAAPDIAGVLSDDLTSALVARRFDPCSERAAAVTCVGREQELDQLEMIFEQCAEDHVASMVLLSGAEGVGKSLLGHEFLRRLTARGSSVATWIGQADVLEAGAVFGLLARVLRRGLDLVDDEPLEVQRDKIRAWLDRHAPPGGARFAEVLGDLVGTPIDGEVNGEHTAGQPPKLPSEEIRQVFLGFLRAECAMRPVIIVLDDLQWGDLSTIKLLYTALGALSDQPLLVLALARTKVHEMFPQLWSDRCVQEIRLRRLSRRSSAQLVRQAFGDTLPEEAVKSLVERSDRHAAYLDELIRTVREGKSGAMPGTVLAMVQARLEKLDPAARRVLRAASIFGNTFWRGGVEELLRGGDAAAWLAVLTEQGVVERRDDARFPGEVEYRFQHALIREAAYEMLTKEDRVAGHWLAGHWLEQVGETDARMIEEHFERCGRGGEPGEPGSYP
jgi:eukaryotic-like serine/threonine-protein kinase